MNEGWTNVVFNNRDPVYLQVVRHFKERIATGRLKAGQVIPSRRELGALLKINPNTAQKAYKEMEEQRLIITEGNSPSRITEEADILRAIRSELLEGAVEAFVVSVGRIDVPVDELLDLVRAKYIEERSRSNQAEGGGL
ncbi:GntR family transcriptional regulator [Paenibacillus sp. chi10]|uniref:GntR family transcriptional regulator n=1 Tax=Paenibacillus suaedae TaxID=3077233 RepID=A0AAJ2JXL0_9BACL|nr:GntR family transcriptional regulator [Paenibacillus sp. chi10]MDT8977721.1 GntR family transcriptional regulator [Paenibacillus sp. chi10]